jgi:hypothetical protein
MAGVQLQVNTRDGSEKIGDFVSVGLENGNNSKPLKEELFSKQYVGTNYKS